MTVVVTSRPARSRGRATAAFETAVAARLGVEQAVSFGYARTALAAILDAVGAGAGDEVILSPLTCRVVSLTLLALNVRPVYADIDERTLNLSAATAAACLGPRTRVLLFQHTYGQASGLGAVAALAADRRIPLIEDCAQCLPLGGTISTPGMTGVAAIFSMNLAKPLGAGAGGIATTQDPDLVERVRGYRDRLPLPSWPAQWRASAERMVYRSLVRPATYWPIYDLYRLISLEYRVRPLEAELTGQIREAAVRATEAQAQVGRAALETLTANVTHRRRRADGYGKRLAAFGGLVPPVVGHEPLYYFPVLHPDKPGFLRAARRRRLEVVAWPINTPIFPIERWDVLDRYGYRVGSCPVAERVASRLVGLPVRPGVSEGTAERVADLVLETAR